MNQSSYRASEVENSQHVRDTLNPYYQEGDVFNRDQSYYDQLLQNPKRDRSNEKSPFKKPDANKDNAGEERVEYQNKTTVLSPSEQLAKLR